MRRMAAALAMPLALCALAGCESTQERSARLQREGGKALAAEKGVVVHARNRDVQILTTAVVHDANGTAVVVALRNRGSQPLARAPLAFEVRRAGGKRVYRNDLAGLDPSLVQVTGVPADGELWWVDDQITASGTPASVTARVGAASGSAPARLPQIEVGAPRLETDPSTGVEAIGTIENRSGVDQRRLVVFCVARQGERVVAAGRAIVTRLAAGKHATYHVFFIGDPRKAQLTVAAPPTVLE